MKNYFFSILSVFIVLLFLIAGCNSGASDASKDGDAEPLKSNIKIYSIKINQDDDCVSRNGGKAVICVRCVATGVDHVTIKNVRGVYNNDTSEPIPTTTESCHSPTNPCIESSCTFTVPCTNVKTMLFCSVPAAPTNTDNLNISFDVTSSTGTTNRSANICVEN